MLQQLTPNNDPPTSDTQMTLSLLQELLMALQASATTLQLRKGD